MDDSSAKVDLRGLLLGVIEQSFDMLCSKSLFTIDAGGHGAIKVEYVDGDGGIRFHAVDYDRMFTWGADHVLVENIPPPSSSVKEIVSLGSLEEDVLRKMVKNEQIPYNLNETTVVTYGKEQYTCILTRTKKGVVADFVDSDTYLFYQFGSRRVKLYAKSIVASARREAQLQREKAMVADKPVHMVEQLDYHRNVEYVDSTVYRNKLVCKCGNVRWIKDSDVFQCHQCKPCIQKGRNRVKAEKKRKKKREQREGKGL